MITGSIVPVSPVPASGTPLVGGDAYLIGEKVYIVVVNRVRPDDKNRWFMLLDLSNGELMSESGAYVMCQPHEATEEALSSKVALKVRALGSVTEVEGN